jgi:streptomycin 6-kinase
MTAWIEGSELARGATAVITRGTPGTVVKTLTRDMPAMAMSLEAAGSRTAMAAGLPVPALLAASLESQPPTLTFEFVDAVALATLYAEVGAANVGRTLADLQHRVRHVANPNVIAVEDFLGYQLSQPEVSPSLRAKAQRDLAQLTAHADRVLCHMDLHDANVLQGPDGPVIIDWMNAAAGPPEADVARTRLVVGHEKYNSPDEEHDLDAALAAYIARTEELAPGLVRASRAWDRVLAAARLTEDPGDGERDAIVARFAA